MRFLNPKPRIIDLPEISGARLSVAEVVLALKDQGMAPPVRAMIQLLVMTRAEYITESQVKARGGVAPLFELGAAQGLEDMLAEMLKLIDGQAGDDAKKFFAD